jgi:hypothetical protein
MAASEAAFVENSNPFYLPQVAEAKTARLMDAAGQASLYD